MDEQCQCRQCLRDRKEGLYLGKDWFIPAEATRMIVCSVCGDKRCIHAMTHEAPCAKDDIYGHNAWIDRHMTYNVELTRAAHGADNTSKGACSASG